MKIPKHLEPDFVNDVDGFVYFWPKGANGCFAAHELREIADELDRRNTKWQSVIDSDPVLNAKRLKDE